MQWDEPMDGRLWFYDSNSDLMWFESREKDEEAGQKRPYSAWLEMGWGLYPTPRVAAKEPEIGDLLATGRKRFQAMEEAIKAETHSLDPWVAAARTAYFDKYYKSDFSKESDKADSSITSTFKHPPPSARSKRDNGNYENQIGLTNGVFNAKQNYALPGGEMYYNPVSGKAEKLSNSEIIFQQWRSAAKTFDEGSGLPALKYLQRSHVSGTGLGPLKTILEANHIDPNKMGDSVEFEPGSEGFLALLAVPNVTSAVWLVLDHGDELGISGIRKMTVYKNKSIVIEFLASKKAKSRDDGKEGES